MFKKAFSVSVAKPNVRRGNRGRIAVKSLRIGYADVRYQGEHVSLFERHSLALFGLNFFSILVNNLETKIEMQEDLENDLIEDKDARDDVKNDSKSSHVYFTQPSDDLNSYMVNKFHPPMAKSKQVPHESIDLSLYKPSAKCLGFTTSEC